MDVPLHKKYITVLAISLVFLVSGCAYRQKAIPQLVSEPNSVDLMLADAADRATRALETLASMEQATKPGNNVTAVPNAPQELRRALTFEWTGPAEPLVQEMAKQAGYDFAIMGAKPPLPIIITIKATNMPIIEILRDIGLQMGGRADMKVDARNQRMEIHYADSINRAGP